MSARQRRRENRDRRFGGRLPVVRFCFLVPGRWFWTFRHLTSGCLRIAGFRISIFEFPLSSFLIRTLDPTLHTSFTEVCHVRVHRPAPLASAHPVERRAARPRLPAALPRPRGRVGAGMETPDDLLRIRRGRGRLRLHDAQRIGPGNRLAGDLLRSLKLPYRLCLGAARLGRHPTADFPLPRPGGKTSAHIRYVYTGLSPEGNGVVDRYTPEWFAGKMQGWETAINHFLSTGRLLEARSWE